MLSATLPVPGQPEQLAAAVFRLMRQLHHVKDGHPAFSGTDQAIPHPLVTMYFIVATWLHHKLFAVDIPK